MNELFIKQKDVPPSSVEAEEAVIGTILLFGQTFHKVSHLLKSNMFYDVRYREMFKAFENLAVNDADIDLITVSSELRSMSSKITPYELSKVVSRIGSDKHIDSHVNLIIDKYQKREMLLSIQSLTNDIIDDIKPAEVISKEAVETMSISSSNNSIDDWDTLLMKAAQSLNKGRDGIKTGSYKLDNHTSGLMPGELVVLAGRPGMGKTAKMLSMALKAAESGPTLIIEQEMSSMALVNRMSSNISGVSGTNIRSAQLNETEILKIHKAHELLSKMPIHVVDISMTASQIHAYGRFIKNKYGLSAVFVDYIQIVDMEKRHTHMEEHVSYVSGRLKKMAKDLNVPVIALSQLNRAVETKSDKRPSLSDLRNSGAIEQDADMVLGLYRPSYYYDQEKDPDYRDETPCPYEQLVETSILKFREGGVGTLVERFYSELSKFEDI